MGRGGAVLPLVLHMLVFECFFSHFLFSPGEVSRVHLRHALGWDLGVEKVELLPARHPHLRVLLEDRCVRACGNWLIAPNTRRPPGAPEGERRKQKRPISLQRRNMALSRRTLRVRAARVSLRAVENNTHHSVCTDSSFFVFIFSMARDNRVCDNLLIITFFPSCGEWTWLTTPNTHPAPATRRKERQKKKKGKCSSGKTMALSQPTDGAARGSLRAATG